MQRAASSYSLSSRDKGQQNVNAQVALAQQVKHAAWRAKHGVQSVLTHADVFTRGDHAPEIILNMRKRNWNK